MSEPTRAALRLCLRKMLGPGWRARLTETAEHQGDHTVHYLAVSFTLSNRQARRLLKAAVGPAGGEQP